MALSDSTGMGKQSGSPASLLTLALVVSAFTTMISSLLSGLLLIEISATFGISIAVAGQMRTVSFALSIVFSLLTGILSQIYDHRKLLLAGLIASCISAVGCSVAPTFSTVLLSFSLTGIAYALTTTMAFTLASEHYPREKRGQTIGFIIAGMSGAYLVGAFVVPYLGLVGGWKATFAGYMLPSSIIGLILVLTAVPSSPAAVTETTAPRLLKSFKAILLDRSAFSSLLGCLLSFAAWQAVLTYNSSFFRQRFGLSVSTASVLILAGAVLYTLGSIVSGRFVGKLGEKTLSALAAMISGLAIMSYSYVPEISVSVGLLFVACFCIGLMDTASTSLVMDQVPQHTGTMMSLQRAVTQIGFSIGSGAGGEILLQYGDYAMVFLVLGSLAVVAAIVFEFATKSPDDSTKKP